MSYSLIVPVAGSKSVNGKALPFEFQFSQDGYMHCVKAIEGLQLSKCDHIYYTLLDSADKRWHLKEMLELQFKRLDIYNVEIVLLTEETNSQAETIYATIKHKEINGPVLIKDADGFFSSDVVVQNSIYIYPLDKMDIVNPKHKSYVCVDENYYITNIIEKKIISRYFNAGGYFFEDVNDFCIYYEKNKDYSPLYMSHIIYTMLLNGYSFRPVEVKGFEDWGNT